MWVAATSAQAAEHNRPANLFLSARIDERMNVARRRCYFVTCRNDA
jgi:hypothetical protein